MRDVMVVKALRGWKWLRRLENVTFTALLLPLLCALWSLSLSAPAHR